MIPSRWHANCQTSLSDECPAMIRKSEGIDVKIEQRQHPRYSIRDAEFRVFSHRTQMTGRLVNLGEGGLAFQFEPGTLKSTECRAIDILGPGADRFYLPGIPCRSIYDIAVLVEGQSFSGNHTRMCGVHFLDLTEDQTRKLTDLIERHGVELSTIS
jgi:hypothetical protein